MIFWNTSGMWVRSSVVLPFSCAGQLSSSGSSSCAPLSPGQYPVIGTVSNRFHRPVTIWIQSIQVLRRRLRKSNGNRISAGLDQSHHSMVPNRSWVTSVSTLQSHVDRSSPVHQRQPWRRWQQVDQVPRVGLRYVLVPFHHRYRRNHRCYQFPRSSCIFFCRLMK